MPGLARGLSPDLHFFLHLKEMKKKCKDRIPKTRRQGVAKLRIFENQEPKVHA
jgi:hypothetical protein